MNVTRRRTPSGLVELLRLLTVLFFAGVGYEIARTVHAVGAGLGPFGFVTVGVIVGSGLGYVLGGVLGRSAIVAADRTESALRDVTADLLVAGAAGVVVGVLLGTAVAWPLFFIPDPLIAFPIFGLVLVILGYCGFRIGASKRDGMLALFGSRVGIAARPLPPSAMPQLIDTSVAIDGRILDVVRAGFLHGTVLVLDAVLAELQGLADAGDDLRRSRGRRGLATLEALRREPALAVEVVPDGHPEIPQVDAKLVRAALDRPAALLTLDTNLARVAALGGVDVLNLHALALALRPPVTAGDEVSVLLLKPGKEPRQAVGYLDDGTMVVVERGSTAIGREVTVRVTSVLTTANGRMVFAAAGPVAAGSATGDLARPGGSAQGGRPA
ncbi:MAG TPA: TRAM domain-containing protein [Mycobacteriales bacterium]|nr:TRAM domain-containing protein [Mycobacteriales bacterium]